MLCINSAFFLHHNCVKYASQINYSVISVKFIVATNVNSFLSPQILK